MLAVIVLLGQAVAPSIALFARIQKTIVAHRLMQTSVTIFVMDQQKPERSSVPIIANAGALFVRLRVYVQRRAHSVRVIVIVAEARADRMVRYVTAPARSASSMV